MQTIIQTPGHAYQRKPNGAYLIRNLETGRWTSLSGIDAFMLDMDLTGCSFAAIDGVLSRHEVQS